MFNSTGGEVLAGILQFLKNKTSLTFSFFVYVVVSQIHIQDPLDDFFNGTFFSKKVIDGNSLSI